MSLWRRGRAPSPKRMRLMQGSHAGVVACLERDDDLVNQVEPQFFLTKVLWVLLGQYSSSRRV